jgi:hypothetical protein
MLDMHQAIFNQIMYKEIDCNPPKSLADVQELWDDPVVGKPSGSRNTTFQGALKSMLSFLAPCLPFHVDVQGLYQMGTNYQLGALRTASQSQSTAIAYPACL